MSKNKRFFWSFFLILTFALLPTLALGQSQIESSYTSYVEPMIQSLQGDKVKLDSDETIEDNFFRYGKNVTIDGNVSGDAIILASEELIVNGIIQGDIIALAEKITINGEVKGNIRAGAETIIINSAIGKNVTIFAGNADFTNQSSVGWSLAFVAGDIDINGPINGNIYGYGGEVNLNTTVGNNVTLFLDEIGVLNIGENTEIGNKLEYRSHNNAVINDSAVIQGDTIHKLIPESVDDAKDFISRFKIYGKFISLFSILLIGTIIVSIFAKTSEKIIHEMKNNPLNKMLWGLLFLIVFPIFLVILAITIIGAPLSLIGLAIYIFLNYISTIFVGLFIGDKILNYKKSNPVNPVWSMMLGALIFSILKNIPVVGMLFGLIGISWFVGTAVILIINIKKQSKGTNNNGKNKS